MTVDENFGAMLHNEVMSLHGGEMSDLASGFIHRTRVGCQRIEGNDIPVE